MRGLYLWGDVGRGKTWLMDLFYASLPFAQRRRRHFHRFMHDVHAELARLKEQRAPLDHIASEIARDTRVLCFDELFVTDIADAMILAGVFEGLFRRGVTLVATSNVTPQELYRHGLQRERFLPAIALLEEHLEVLHVAGATDYRLRQLTQAGTYLSVGSPGTAARLEGLFRELSGADTQLGGTLQIEGRAIAVVRAANAAVWFDFKALCAGPRSQEDYIEIAREFQSVFVSDVPVFGADHEDEARRFIALVDELYERNVNLVALGSRRTRAALCRHPPAPALRAHRESPDRDAERAVSRARTPPLSRRRPPSDHAAADLVLLDRLEQRAEVALAETLVALALDDLEEDRADDVLREDLQQHALALLGIAVDEDAPLAQLLERLVVTRDARRDALVVGVRGVLEGDARAGAARPRCGRCSRSRARCAGCPRRGTRAGTPRSGSCRPATR